MHGVAYEIVGFEETRTEGGTHHVLRRQRTGRVMCHGCLTDLKAGVTSGQLAIR